MCHFKDNEYVIIRYKGYKWQIEHNNKRKREHFYVNNYNRHFSGKEGCFDYKSVIKQELLEKKARRLRLSRNERIQGLFVISHLETSSK